MSSEKAYNGWTNYETWNVALWLDNDQGTYTYWREVAQECWDDAAPGEDRDDEAASALRDRLKDEIEESAPDLGASVWSDLLSAAMSEVNWQEIAESWIAEVDKTAAEDDE